MSLTRVPGRTLRNALISGAAGMMALNALTYLDLAIQARPPSPLPEKTVDALADRFGVDLGHKEETVENREQGLGPLLGMVTGLAVACAYGVIRESLPRVPLPAAAVGVGLAAIAAADTPITALGLTDPRKWGLSGWMSDLIPHLGYGLVVAAVYEKIRPC